MRGLYVIDTVGFINYFRSFFGEEEKLSSKTREIIEFCFDYNRSDYKLSIPSVVFIEVFEKFLRGQEKVVKFKYEILSRIENNPDVEIKSIDKDLLKNFSFIDDSIIKLEYHDKLITAAALQLNCTLITCDSKIEAYMEKATSVVPLIF